MLSNCICLQKCTPFTVDGDTGQPEGQEIDEQEAGAGACGVKRNQCHMLFESETEMSVRLGDCVKEEEIDVRDGDTFCGTCT